MFVKKKFWRKNTLIIICSILIAGTAGYSAYLQFSKADVKVNEVTATAESDSNTKTFIEIEETNAKPVEEEFPLNIGEGEVQIAIHKMSHQKIEADEKWGFLPLTQERIKRLIKVVNSGNYEHKSLYLEILNRWSNGDFSQADKDHNAIWRLQGGSVGEATGVLSTEEEKAFIEEHFDVD